MWHVWEVLDTRTCAGDLWLAVAAVVKSPADSKVLTDQVASVHQNKVGGAGLWNECVVTV